MNKNDDFIENNYSIGFIKEIVSNYCDAIEEYEKYKDNENDDDKKLDDFLTIPILNTIKSWYEKEFMTWRNVDEELQTYLFNLLFSKDKKILKYLQIEDIVSDELSDSLERSLSNYYKKQGINIKDENIKDKILKESIDYLKSDTLDNNIFSKREIELHKIVKKLEIVCGQLYKIYNDSYSKVDSREDEISL